MSSNENLNFDYGKINVKMEKPSPPRNRTKTEQDELNFFNSDLFPSPSTSNIIKTESSHIHNNVTSSTNETDDKNQIEKLKSSNEILAELFKVFNAAPPETLLNGELLLQKMKKNKKHKKSKKHKKKSKKKGRSSSDSISSSENESEKSYKKDKSEKKNKKKKKKSKRKALDENTATSKKIMIKSEKNNKKIDDDFSISDYEEGELKLRFPIIIKTEKKDKEKIFSDKTKPKITIKSVKNSKTFKNIEEKEREKDRDRAHRSSRKKLNRIDSDSEISLSDEESYLREREKIFFYDGNFGRSKNREHEWRDNNRYETSRRQNDRSRSSWRNSSTKRSRSRSRRRRSRSRDLGIDKKRLLEIARKNAISMFKQGSLPGTQQMTQEIKDKVLLKMRYGGKTVEDLTDFCKKLSNGENLDDISDLSEESDHDRDGNDKAFHHPFILKDRGPIVMNIKNAIPIAPKTAEQTKALLMQFPVSSGQQHRINESEWVPVPTATKKPEPKCAMPLIAPSKTSTTKNVFSKPLPIDKQQPAFLPVPVESNFSLESKPVEVNIQTPEPAETTLSLDEATALSTPPTESIFPEVSHNIDVASVVTKRLNAMRRLQENPMDSEAMKMMYSAQKEMSAWASSKHLPGQFTGSTGVSVLSAKELNSGIQAWAKRDTLTSTAPVSGGMGMHLLQKMGWKPGEGLGRERNGALQPLLLEVKLDKRGLVSEEEDPAKKRQRIQQEQVNRKRKRENAIRKAQENFENKHPVSLLGEIASKRRWGGPAFELVEDTGPAHNKSFIFKVIVNDVIYQPAISSNTKKQAKALAAKYCLQQLGVLST